MKMFHPADVGEQDYFFWRYYYIFWTLIFDYSHKELMTEIYKLLNDLSHPIMNDIFRKQENYYSLRKPRSLVSKRKFTTTYGIDTISFRGPQIWQDPPQEIKNPNSSNFFKSNMKRYRTLTRHCELC